MPALYPSFTKTYHHDVYPAIDPKQFDCSDKIVLITGGGRGIGRAIATSFAQAHAKGIALLGRTKSTLEETAEEVKKVSEGKSDPVVVTADITNKAQVRAAMDATIEHFGGRVPDVLVNNAGGHPGVGHLIDVDIDEFMDCFDLNVRGPLTVAQTLLQAVQDKDSLDKKRTVINLPSGGAIIPYSPTGASYACAKLANTKVCEYLHHENPSWNVFNMQPGVVDTDLARAAGRKAPDKPALPAGFAVWLASHPDARELNGKFIWANWDINEVLERKKEIQDRELLSVWLKGWAEEQNAQDMINIARSVYRDADREK